MARERSGLEGGVLKPAARIIWNQLSWKMELYVCVCGERGLLLEYKDTAIVRFEAEVVEVAEPDTDDEGPGWSSTGKGRGSGRASNAMP